MNDTLTCITAYISGNSGIYKSLPFIYYPCEIVTSHSFHNYVNIFTSRKSWTNSYNKRCHVHKSSKIFLCDYRIYYDVRS